MTVGMQRESSARATSMRMSDVLFGYIFQFFLTKNDKLTVTSLFGAIFITSSIIIIMYFKPQKSNNSNDANTNTNTNTKNNERSNNEKKQNNSNNVISDAENPIIEMIKPKKKIKYTSLPHEDEDKDYDEN
jgi:hypothetical protein